MRIILASASPRRKALLEQIGLRFDVLVPDTEEDAGHGKNPRDIVMGNAEKKSAAAAKTLARPALIIAADTVVELDGLILGKPENPGDAFEMLARLSEKCHAVHSGVCLYRSDIPVKRTFAERADVYMRKITPAEIHAYIKTGEPMDKAGSYGLQGFGAVFVRRIEGDYSTVIGLPLCALWRELELMRENL